MVPSNEDKVDPAQAEVSGRLSHLAPGSALHLNCWLRAWNALALPLPPTNIPFHLHRRGRYYTPDCCFIVLSLPIVMPPKRTFATGQPPAKSPLALPFLSTPSYSHRR